MRADGPKKNIAQILRSTLLAMMVWLLWSLPSLAVGGQQSDSGVRVRSMGEGMWLVESATDWNGSRISANALVLSTADEVLVVDTPWTDEQTSQLFDWIAIEIDLPIRRLVVTHAHQDRIGGIAEVHGRGVETLGFEGTSELARALGYESPRVTFSDRLDIDLGDEIVTLVYPGPGHSPDNIVIWFEGRRLLYGGCLIKSLASRGLGYTGDADLGAWSTTLAGLQPLEPAIVIPGHGEPGGAELIEHTLDLLARHGDPRAR